MFAVTAYTLFKFVRSRSCALAQIVAARYGQPTPTMSGMAFTQSLELYYQHTCLVCGQYVPVQLQEAHLQDAGHWALASRIVAQELVVPKRFVQNRWRMLDVPASLMKIGIERSCDVLIGPHWFSDLLYSDTPHVVVRQTALRAAEDDKFRDALIAAAALDTGVQTLAIAQYKGNQSDE